MINKTFMKTSNSFNIILLFLLILSISSCTRKRNYEFLIKNNTNYNINTLKLGCGQEDSKEISIEPNGEKEITYFNRGTFFDFTDPLLCITISKYSDTITTYENSEGGVTSIKDLKKKESNILTIEIDPNPNSQTNIFDIKVN